MLAFFVINYGKTNCSVVTIPLGRSTEFEVSRFTRLRSKIYKIRWFGVVMVSQRNDRPYHSIDDIRLFIGLLLRCPYLAPFLKVKYSGSSVKNRQFYLYPHLYLVPVLRVTPLEFDHDLLSQKTSDPCYHDDNNMFSHFDRTRACGRRTNTGSWHIHCASISSRGKNRDSDLCKCSHFCSVSCHSETCQTTWLNDEQLPFSSVFQPDTITA